MRFWSLAFAFVACVIAAGCGSPDIGQVPSASAINAAVQIRPPKTTPTPDLAQELFVARNCEDCEAVVALAPPHGKPTYVDPSFMTSYDNGDSPIVASSAGDLFVVMTRGCYTASGECIAEFAPPYTKKPIAVIAGSFGSGPCEGMHCLALDANQNLYSATYDSSTYYVGEWAPPYKGAPSAVLEASKSLSINGMFSIASNGSDLFAGLQVCKAPCSSDVFDDYAAGYTPSLQWNKPIGSVTAGGINGCQRGYSTYACNPYDATFDSSGDLFVSFGPCGHGACGNLVAEWPAPYKGKPKAVITTDVDNPRSIALDSKGDLFVLSRDVASQQKITEYAPPYKKSPIVISQGIGANDDLGMIVVDSADNLFLSDYGSGGDGEILEYKPPYTGLPIEITAGFTDFAPIYLALGPKVKAK
jgi:hypothetical protein